MAIFAIGIVFNAGVAYTLLRQVRRDLNGLGKKHRKLEALVFDIAPADKQTEVGKALLNGIPH